MTINMFQGRADVGQVAQLVREHEADVLSAQELTPSAAGKLRPQAWRSS